MNGINVETSVTLTALEMNELVNFLYGSLDEFRDEKHDIAKAIEYALGMNGRPGGLIIQAKQEGAIAGAVVLNKTGMQGYIPENILVFIAVKKDFRGKGLGRILMERAFESTSGAIALHVEPNNPARFLYEKLGFTNKYLEMRKVL
ncbi:MAG: GNAT family N-acetyltransferase [Bacteroidetes bacterium]|nr:GNAT family N-acetyltransferase [Bacteroidota bacterium]MBU1719018.1 GNAT family N-acetyltransferase [Bacteroidota bacterium]